MTRGLRNNNPGNIRHSKDNWLGQSETQTDPSFVQFYAIEYGYRALIRTLQNYHKKHGCQTIDDYINRWAPPCENNTGGYIARVCKEMQIPNTYIPDVDDKSTMVAFAAAISRVENGIAANIEDVEKGWSLL